MNEIIDERPVMVSIRCATYNHAPYIRQCLDGFVMQKTNFLFEAIVHDDASTDGTTDIVCEYAKKYPDIVKPMYETENQYSKNLSAMNDAINCRLIGKYVAICEGDDYWTDPLKLQKQFDYMETHPECTLCFHANYREYSDGRKEEHFPNVKKDIYTVRDVITGGGGMMATNSMFFHKSNYPMAKDKPDFWRNSVFVGDVPLRLYLSSKGTVGYIDEIMSVYRRGYGSWFQRNQKISTRINTTKAAQKVLEEFDEFTGRKYHKSMIKGKILLWLKCVKMVFGIIKRKISAW